MKSAFGKFILIVLTLFIGVMLFLYYANYSDGYRAGVPIKISHKGKLIKTHEGELNEGGLTNTAQGVLPSKWAFSIKDKDSEVRKKLEEAIEENRRVKVYYYEKYAQLFWLGDTKYFVHKVQILDE